MINNHIITWTARTWCLPGVRNATLSFNSISFISIRWAVTEWPAFWIGVTLCFITSFLTTAYGPIFRKQIKIVSTNKFQLTGGYLIEYLLKLFVMLLMMTMNAPVCIAISLGIALGYTVFSYYGEKIRKTIFCDHDWFPNLKHLISYF